MNYCIESIEYYLPEKVINNEFLSNECGIDKSFLEEKVGIFERRVALPDEPTSAMCVKAGEKLFKNSNVIKEDIGLLIVCTQNPDYRLPTTACIVQDRLGLAKSTMAFDINLGCSGFTYSLEIAGNFIRTGAVKKALIITADQYSKVINYRDRATAGIFGDAAAATLLAPCDEGYGVIGSNYGTDGSGWMHLIVPNSGVAKDETRDNFLFMNGQEIFKFTVLTIPKYMNELLAKCNIGVEDFKYVVMHQANKYMLKEMQKRMKINDEQMIIDMAKFGNTVSATIPIALKNIISSEKLSKGDLLLFSGFGVGLSFGNVIYKYI